MRGRRETRLRITRVARGGNKRGGGGPPKKRPFTKAATKIGELQGMGNHGGGKGRGDKKSERLMSVRL